MVNLHKIFVNELPHFWIQKTFFFKNLNFLNFPVEGIFLWVYILLFKGTCYQVTSVTCWGT
jgi:hypothetical protein